MNRPMPSGRPIPVEPIHVFIDDFQAPAAHAVRTVIHAQDCACRHCQPDRLDAQAMALLTIVGFLVATAIALFIDPAGVIAVLADMVGVRS